MRRLQQRAAESKIASSVITVVGVTSFLTLFSSLVLWAFSHIEYGVGGGGIGNYRLLVDSWNGLLSVAIVDTGHPQLSKSSNLHLYPSKWRLRTVQLNDARILKIQKRTLLKWNTIRIQRGGFWPIEVNVAYSAIAIGSLITFLLAVSLSFRFTMRTLFVTLTLCSLLFGMMAIAVRS